MEYLAYLCSRLQEAVNYSACGRVCLVTTRKNQNKDNMDNFNSSRQKLSVSFLLMAILFNVCLIASNLFETKLFMAGPVALTGGVVIFPISYIINDCLVEVWGYRKARLVIWSGFVMNFFVVAMAVNAWIMSRMKVASKGRRFSLRAIVSSIGGETVDSLIFFPIAFWGLGADDMVRLMLTQIVLKTLYEVIILPVTNAVVHRLKRFEGEDTFDEHISYNPFKIFDL